LLNLLPDTVALDEPIDMAPMINQFAPPHQSSGPPDANGASHPSLVCDFLDRFLAETRESITTRKSAVSYQVQGRVLGAKVADDQGPLRPRTDMSTRREIRLEKELSANFLLVAKHPVAFTALLETLVQRFPVFAIVRNPLSLLSSWQTVPFPIREGRLVPVAERFDPRLASTLATIDNRLDRQLHILGWYFEKYRRLLPEDRIIRYEDVVGSGGRALSVIASGASELNERLENRNRAAVYDRRAMRMIAERLLEAEGAYWRFYTRESVSSLLDP
jgi:ribosome-associated protein YbcJ (S4-like RNA binding protein)